MKTIASLVRRLFLLGLPGAAVWVFVFAPAPLVQAGVSPLPVAQEQVVGEGPNRAALVVRYADDSTQTRCVAFSESEITGDELLTRSGLEPVIAPEGNICGINGLGCPADDCFCKCPFPDCEYWAYYHWQDDAWSYSQIGATGSVVTDGALEGWSWGQGNFQQGTDPAAIPFEEICPAGSGAGALAPAGTQGNPSAAGTDAAAPATDVPLLPASAAAALAEGESPAANPAIRASSPGAVRQIAESRSFSPELLPGYAAYLLTMAALALIGGYVLRRRNRSWAVPVRALPDGALSHGEATQEPGRPSRDSYGRRYE